ncbi:MAG TPA: TetR/AcrR family transcriptional regulator [Gemmatimonadales bacterium]|nr:TetR/AcrR family transcriptional regulator [Gemmatimonadales bacterium]
MTKGETTRGAILIEAANLASINGLNGLTIGTLAAHTGMSKSGLFRHFGSKEDLQVATLKAGVDRFMDVVVRPALKAPRGVARVRELFTRWLDWETEKGLEGGCLFIAASIELDDQPGAARDYLVTTQGQWLGFLAQAARRAVDAGDFRPDLDVAQFAHEFNAIFLGFHQAHRLMRDPAAADRASRQFDRLVRDASHAGAPA